MPQLPNSSPCHLCHYHHLYDRWSVKSAPICWCGEALPLSAARSTSILHEDLGDEVSKIWGKVVILCVGKPQQRNPLPSHLHPNSHDQGPIIFLIYHYYRVGGPPDVYRSHGVLGTLCTNAAFALARKRLKSQRHGIPRCRHPTCTSFHLWLHLRKHLGFRWTRVFMEKKNGHYD